MPKFSSFNSVSIGGALFASAFLSACSPTSGDSASERAPMADYCPYVTAPRAYSSAMTVTGTAKYQYRIDGNGIIPNGANAVVPVIPSSGATTTVSMDVNGVGVSFTCTSPCHQAKAAAGLVSRVQTLLSASGITAHGQSEVGVYRSSGSGTITLSNLNNVAFADARPIRHAEVRATNAAGEIVQCAETSSTGSFSLALPSDGARYTISVLSRASNAMNTAYIMNTPTANEPYVLSNTVQTTSGTALSFLAPATGSLEGGAFNILDQILNAQSYMRSTTANCNQSMMTNYFSGCQPFTTAPMVYTYWSPGVSPGVYYGISGPISFYLNGDRELYILGGENGNTTASDMDHFDNSVVIHEYGHFIEDQFGRPNSPGGSHNGNAIIDPRLAWGEGWANYFQAAVTGIPYYRDTKGYVNCGTGCSPITAFNEPLDTTSGGTIKDNPSTLGEGNFREFSVSRALWNITKNISQFSEVWTSLAGTGGMRSIADSFKSIGRFHVIQSGISNKTSWSSAQTAEKQQPNFTDYATRLSTTSGSCSATALAVSVTSGDDGSFGDSDLFRNNDFYVYNHPGGQLSVTLEWSGADAADLDLYIYKPGYTYGDTSSDSMAAKNDVETNSTSGSATVAPNLGAGTYMINVMAYTGFYTTNGTKNTAYTLKIGGQTACPSAL